MHYEPLFTPLFTPEHATFTIFNYEAHSNYEGFHYEHVPHYEAHSLTSALTLGQYNMKQCNMKQYSVKQYNTINTIQDEAMLYIHPHTHPHTSLPRYASNTITDHTYIQVPR